MTIHLTDIQRNLLTAAALRADRVLAPTAGLKGSVANKVAARLVEEGSFARSGPRAKCQSGVATLRAPVSSRSG
jgi:hypothetical protein